MPILRPIIVALVPFILAIAYFRGNVIGGALAVSSVCAINNTTVTTGGSPATVRSEVFSVAWLPL